MSSKMTLDEIKELIKEVKASKAAGGEPVVVPPSKPPVVEVSRVEPEEPVLTEGEGEVKEAETIKKVTPVTTPAVDKRSAKERIVELIERGERVSANYYAARGTHIIEIIFPTDYEQDILDVVERCKIDPKAPWVMMQDPSFAEVHPEDARGIGAFQFYVNNPEELVTSGYDILKMLELLKPEPVIVTASTTINQKPLIKALK